MQMVWWRQQHEKRKERTLKLSDLDHGRFLFLVVEVADGFQRFPSWEMEVDHRHVV